ncbi:PHP domain-containing protein [Methanolobus sediminis]|uniref:PHP domain-containing protein n=1 Tax=Methanolobus sediminis TaxID=3072978 RepID=A0AA51YLC2_9EURY|nr:PHP domain-containing protein [Methanolobus sediminis]WMW24373.1 PHP domain-containing protein [Methanolobus sediminis]
MFRKQNSTMQRIIASDRAEELLENGWHKADLHVHTSCSYDVPASKFTKPENLFQKGLAEGLNFVTFTDHDTVKAYDRMGWNRDKLTTGVELSITDMENVGHTIHINAFEFDKGQYFEMETIVQKKQDVHMLLDYFRDNDILHMYNHPFWFKPGEKPNIMAVPELAKHFPVIEYNMQDLKQKNFFSMILAQRFKKGMAVTTDSHTGRIGRVHTLAKGDTFREYFKNIEKGKSYMMIDEPIWKHISHEMNAWVELVFNMEKRMPYEGDYSTGVEVFDRVVGLVCGDNRDKHPHMYSMTMHFAQQFFGSGLPFLLYRISKQPQVTRIGRVVNS